MLFLNGTSIKYPYDTLYFESSVIFTLLYKAGTYSFEQFRNYAYLKYGAPNDEFLLKVCKTDCNASNILDIAQKNTFAEWSLILDSHI